MPPAAFGRYGSPMTNGTPQNAPGADWYADPSTPGQLRFWDGAAWTAHVKAAPVVPVMPAPAVAQPLYAGSAQPAQYTAQPAPKKLANRAAGIGMFGVLLAGIGIVLAIFIGATAANLAVIVGLIGGGAVVFVISLVFCVIFTIQRR